MDKYNSTKTIYNGVVFRSSLEARWAREFERRSIKWEYEPEKYLTELGHTYTFDFKLKICDVDVYIEVKPNWELWLKSKSQKANIWQVIKTIKEDRPTTCFYMIYSYPGVIIDVIDLFPDNKGLSECVMVKLVSLLEMKLSPKRIICGLTSLDRIRAMHYDSKDLPELDF